MKTEHKWIGGGWDESICKHCGVNAYVPFSCGKYCEDYEQEKQAWLEIPKRRLEALDFARQTLTEQQYNLLELTRFGPYKV